MIIGSLVVHTSLQLHTLQYKYSGYWYAHSPFNKLHAVFVLTYSLQALLPKAVVTSNVLVSSSSPAVGLTYHAACLAQAPLTWHTYII